MLFAIYPFIALPLITLFVHMPYLPSLYRSLYCGLYEQLFPIQIKFFTILKPTLYTEVHYCTTLNIVIVREVERRSALRKPEFSSVLLIQCQFSPTLSVSSEPSTQEHR